MSAAAVLSCSGVHVSFGGFRALNGVSVDFYRNGKYGLIGPNGAGKTTLVNVLSGALRPTSGSVAYKCVQIGEEPRHSELRRGISRGFQTASLFPEYTVLDNLLLAAQAAAGRVAMHRLAHNDLVLSRRVTEMLETLELQQSAQKLAGLLSHGDQRALEIGLTCISDPEILLLDEPLAGVGVGVIDKTVALIERFTKNRTVVMIEHNMDALLKIVDSVIVLAGGEVIAHGPTDEVRRNEVVQRAYLGTED